MSWLKDKLSSSSLFKWTGLTLLNAYIPTAYTLYKWIMPDVPDIGPYPEAPQPDAVYDARLTNGIAGIGAQIPVVYGKVLTTPSNIMRPYASFNTYVLDGSRTKISAYRINTVTVSSDGQAVVTLRTLVSSGRIGTSRQLGLADNNVVMPALTSGSKYQVLVNNVVTNIGALATSGFTIHIDTKDIFDDAAVLDNHPNLQYTFNLFAIGNGDHTVHNIKLGDVFVKPVLAGLVTYNSFTKAAHQERMGVISDAMNNATPDSKIPRFHEHVVISSLANGVQFEKNINASMQYPVGRDDLTLTELQLDLSFDRGFYALRTDGVATRAQRDINLVLRNFDAAGNQRDIIYKGFRMETRKHITTPQRLTYVIPLPKPSGNYRQGVWTLSIGSSYDYKDGFENYVAVDFTMVQLRGVVKRATGRVYGDTHLLATRITGGDAISSNNNNQVRVSCTRKLTRLDGSFGESRSAVDAFADIVTNTQYGGMIDSSNLDKAFLTKMHARFGGTATEHGYNGVFSGNGDLFTTLGNVTFPVAATPLIKEDLITMSYDGVKDVSHTFNETNIIRDSFSVTYSFFRQTDYDYLKVGYRNPDTFEVVYVDFPAPSGTGVQRPEVVELYGCTDSTVARQYAQYLWNKRKLVRKLVRLQVELEGKLVYVGDLIGVSHTLVDWGLSGEILDYDAATGSISLDDIDIDFTVPGSWFLVVRRKDGTLLPSLEVTYVSDNIVRFVTPPSDTITEGMSYMLGLGSKQYEKFVVTSVEPDDELISTINGQAYETAVFNGAMPFLKTKVT